MSDETFDVEFEDDILAQCMRDVEYLKNALTIIEGHHFSTEQHTWLYQVIKDTWESSAELTSISIITANARAEFDDLDERSAALELAAKLRRKKPETPRAALNELEKFVRFVKLQTAGEEMARAMERGNLDKAYTTMREVVMRDARPSGFQVTDWMGGFSQRLRDQKFKRDHPDLYPIIPTGFKKLDGIIDGIRQKEFGLVLGATGRGKSIVGVHLGYTAVKKVRDIGVAHFNYEMHHAQVAMRYDARFTMMLHRKFKTYEFTDEEIRAITSRVRKSFAKYNNRLKIISAPVRSATLAQTRRLVDELQSTMEVPIRLIILDSPDHFLPERTYKDKRHEATDIYWGVKGWAESEDISVWGTMQAGKQAAKRIAEAEDASEAYEKSRIADHVLSVNRPESRTRATPKVEVGEDSEDDETAVAVESKSDIELFLSKYRDGESQIRIPLETDLARMMLKDAAEGGKK